MTYFKLPKMNAAAKEYDSPAVFNQRTVKE